MFTLLSAFIFCLRLSHGWRDFFTRGPGVEDVLLVPVHFETRLHSFVLKTKWRLESIFLATFG